MARVVDTVEYLRRELGLPLGLTMAETIDRAATELGIEKEVASLPLVIRAEACAASISKGPRKTSVAPFPVAPLPMNDPNLPLAEVKGTAVNNEELKAESEKNDTRDNLAAMIALKDKIAAKEKNIAALQSENRH